jgi:hypothetical protein
MAPSWALLWVMAFPWVTSAPPLLAGDDIVPL